MSYINSYIDIRAKQLYAKLKDFVYKIVGKYNGPWDYIVLRDINNLEMLYKIYIKEGGLHSKSMDDTQDRLDTICETISNMDARTTELEGEVPNVDAQITQLEHNVSDLDGRIDTLSANTSTFTDRIRTINGSIVAMDSRITNLDNNINLMGVSVDGMQHNLVNLDTRVARLENDEPKPVDESVVSAITELQSNVATLSGDISMI